jgi:hypothetical protein
MERCHENSNSGIADFGAEIALFSRPKSAATETTTRAISIWNKSSALVFSIMRSLMKARSYYGFLCLTMELNNVE